MKILIVDDHAYNRDLLNFILQDEGYECVEAESGIEACKAVHEDKEIDLVLMDVNMPEMDGLEATAKIKEDAQDRFIPIIFVTALDDTDNLSQCLDAGGDDFVGKPVNETALIAKIKAHTRTKKLYSELQSAHKKLEYHNELMAREHAIVEHVFARGANRISTICDNVHLYSSPMSMFNGDVVLQSPSPSGGVYILLGDFTGHGLAASIGTLPVTEIFYNHAERQASVSQIAEQINRRLFDLLPTNMFFCATIAYLEHQSNQLIMWSGGMNDTLIVSRSGGPVRKVEAEHMPIGILSNEEFEDTITHVELNIDDIVCIYSDGVNEAQSPDGEEFGLDRLNDLVAKGGENIVLNITDTVHQFQGGEGQSDDLSLVALFAGDVIHRDKETKEVVDVGVEYHSAESFPWQMKMRLENDDLRKTSIVDQVMGFVSSIQGIEIHQDKIFTIVSELYSNALEHGVLNLDSKLKSTADGFEQYYMLREKRLAEIDNQFIELKFSYISGQPNKIRLVITDSGRGFDYESIQRSVIENEDSHGRGLGLLTSLCSHLEYSNQGRTVSALYELCR